MTKTVASAYRIFAHGECRFIDEHQSERRIRAGLHEVAAIYRRINFESHCGAVNSHSNHCSLDNTGHADGIIILSAALGRGIGGGQNYECALDGGGDAL
jgi:hypothetical protein